MNYDPLCVQTRAEEIVLREIHEQLDRVPAALKAAGELHHLTLGSAGTEMVDDQ